jgi:hypothetical protein
MRRNGRSSSGGLTANLWLTPIRVTWIRRFILDDAECAMWTEFWKEIDHCREQIRRQ